MWKCHGPEPDGAWWNSAQPTLLLGTADPDELTGTASNDLVFGFDGGDTIRGMIGDDTIVGGSGDDRILGDGEAGPAPPIGPPPPEGTPMPGNNLILGGDGNDTVIAGWGSDTVIGGGGDDHIIGYGAGFPSPAGFDAFLRGDGPALLDGGTGNDTLEGGGGADTLIGGDGNDVLMGGYGADLMAGGLGADLFVFQPHDPFRSSPDTGVGEGQRDMILDFGQGDDVIDLSRYRALGGTDPAPVFLGTEEFTETAALQVRYDILEDGRTVVQFVRGRIAPPDGEAGLPAAPTGEIMLMGQHHLTADDFYLG